MKGKRKAEFPGLLVTAVAFALLPTLLGPAYLISTSGGELTLAVSKMLGWPLLIAFGIALLLLALVMWLATTGRWRVVAIFSAVTLFLYVQFFLLSLGLAPLDGRDPAETIGSWRPTIEIVALGTLIVAALLTPLRFVRVAAIFLGVLILLQPVALLTERNAVPGGSMRSEEAPEYYTASQEQMQETVNLAPRNVVLIIVDTLQGSVLEDILLRNDEIAQKFAGFTVYNNAAGLYPYTLLSVPAIFSGKAYLPDGGPLHEYHSQIAAKSILSRARSAGHSVGGIPLTGRLDFLSAESILCRKYADVYDLYLYRQAPTPLKAWIYNDGEMRFRLHCARQHPSTESEVDLEVLDDLVTDSAVGVEGTAFRFVHLWGMHLPARLRPTCAPAAPSYTLAAMDGQAECILGRIGDYLDRLAELGVAESTMVLVVADHGSKHGFARQRAAGGMLPSLLSSANPAVAVRDFGDAGKVRFTAVPASILDVEATIASALGLSPAGDGVDLRDVSDAVRPRTFFDYADSDDPKDGTIDKVATYHILGDVRDPAAWSTASEAELPILDYVDLGDQTELSLSPGWAEAPEVSGAWMASNSVAVYGTLPDAGDYTFVVRCMNRHLAQKLTVRVNGRVLSTLELDQTETWAEYRTDVTLLDEEAGAAAELRFEVSEFGRISERDPRSLGILIDYVRFRRRD